MVLSLTFGAIAAIITLPFLLQHFFFRFDQIDKLN